MNQLFHKWLLEWEQDAKKQHNLNLVFVYKRAANAILACSNVLNNASETLSIKGIGPTICNRLEKRLNEHLGKENHHIIPIKSSEISRSKSQRQNAKLDSELVLSQAISLESISLNDESNNQQIVHMPKGTFDVVLIIDQREAKRDRDTTAIIQSKLLAEGISFIQRIIPVGDFVWICKSKKDPKLEFTLDYIIERKREDDLVSSILDGRFEEQRSRLSRSEFRNVMYIIERYVSKFPSFQTSVIDNFGRGRFLSALLSTQLVHNFVVKQTNGLNDTLNFLISITRALERKYSNRDLKAMKNSYARYERINNSTISPLFLSHFNDFSRMNSKNTLTLSDLYLKQLCCIRMMTLEKALAISRLYSSWNALYHAYSEKGLSMPKEKRNIELEQMLQDIEYLPGKRIGKTLSKRIFELVWIE